MLIWACRVAPAPPTAASKKTRSTPRPSASRAVAATRKEGAVKATRESCVGSTRINSAIETFEQGEENKTKKDERTVKKLFFLFFYPPADR